MAGEIGHWCGIDFIGGGLGSVDKIDGAVLQNKEGFLVITPTVFAPLSLDTDSGAAENSPQVITPNTNPGTKRWILAGGVFAGLTLYGNVVMPDNGLIGIAAGPQVRFDSTNDYLEITGCDVAVGGAIARTKLHVITTNVSAIDWSTMIQNLHAASDMGGTGVGLKLKTYSDSQTEQNINKWTGIASESQSSPTFGKRVDQVFYTVADASAAAPTEKMRITGAGLVGIGTTPDTLLHLKGVNPELRFEESTAGNLVDFRSSDSGAFVIEQNYDTDATGHIYIRPTITGHTFTKNLYLCDQGGNVIISTKLGVNDINPVSYIDVNGDINTTDVYKVDDVQVVSNRVVDARCDDAINTGDATSDGVIDSLRDAMITHGLIAAA